MGTINGSKSVEDIVKARYMRNFLLLREKAPHIFGRINEKTDIDWSIKVGADGSINAIINGQELYPYDPKRIAKEQVEEYSKAPKRVSVPFLSPPADDGSVHSKFYSQIVGDFFEEPFDLSFKFDGKFIPVMIVFGMGFGHHVIELIRRYDIGSMIVIEPNSVFLNLSLYSIEWKEILDYFAKPNRSFVTVFSDDPEQIKSEIKKAFSVINPAFSVHVFLFEHFKSPFFEEVVEFIKTNNPLNPWLWGTIDSELSSLKHLIGLVNDRVPVYYGLKEADPDVPVFIVGSGPSLDKLEDTLRANLDKAIVVSCGTATKSLYRMGIKPDFHVIADWQSLNYDLIKSIDRKFMKSLYVLGTPFCHPGVFKAGKKGGMFVPATVGISSASFPPNVPRITNTPPTVTSAAIAFLAHAGFRKFYLFGVDMGSRDPQEHHSKKTDYYDPNSPIYNYPVGFDIEVEANFGGVAYTNRSLYTSKSNIEKTIKKFGLEVYNLSDGAKIEGALPLEAGSLSLREGLEKEKVAKDIFKNFRSTYIKEMKLRKKLESVEEDIEQFVSQIRPLMINGVGSVRELVEIFSKAHHKIVQMGLARGESGNYLTYILIAQSLYKYEMFLLSAAYVGDEQRVKKLTSRAFPVILDYLIYAREQVGTLLKSLKV